MTNPVEVLIPLAMRRSVLANGEGGPLSFARGEVAGRPAELVGGRARLDLRCGGESVVSLLLGDWTAEALGEDPPVGPGTEAWRFGVTVGDTELEAEVAKRKRGRSLLSDAARYWRLSGAGQTWYWGDGPAPENGGRDRTFSVWRDEPVGEPLASLTLTEVGERNVENVVCAVGETRRLAAATDIDEQLLVLLAVGGFQVEIVGRNERIGKARKWLVDAAFDEVDPYR